MKALKLGLTVVVAMNLSLPAMADDAKSQLTQSEKNLRTTEGFLTMLGSSGIFAGGEYLAINQLQQSLKIRGYETSVAHDQISDYFKRLEQVDKQITRLKPTIDPDLVAERDLLIARLENYRSAHKAYLQGRPNLKNLRKYQQKIVGDNPNMKAAAKLDGRATVLKVGGRTVGVFGGAYGAYLMYTGMGKTAKASEQVDVSSDPGLSFALANFYENNQAKLNTGTGEGVEASN